MTPINGGGIVSDVIEKIESEKDARRVLKEAFDGFPFTILKAEVAGDPAIAERDENAVTLNVQVRMTADRREYDKFSSRLIKALDSVPHKSETFTVTAREEGGMFVPESVVRNGIRSNGLTWRVSERATRSVPSIVVLKDQSEDHARTTWASYRIDGAIAPPLSELCERAVTVRLDFLDEGGEAVRSESIKLDSFWTQNDRHCAATFLYPASGRGTNYFGRASHSYQGYFVSPLFLGGSSPFDCRYTPTVTVNQRVSFPLSEAGRIKSVRCLVEKP